MTPQGTVIPDARRERIVREAYVTAARTFPEVEDFSVHCLVLAGAVIATASKHGLRLVLQAGSAYWPRVTDETDDGVEANRFGYEWTPNEHASRLRRAMGLMPEIHVWAADPRPGVLEIVDLTAGAFPEQCAQLTGETWKAPRPPKWFWGTAKDLPPLASYVPTLDATQFAARMLAQALTERKHVK